MHHPAPRTATEEPTIVPVRDRVVGAFASRYGTAPGVLARAPGRVNLIGDHTDYNDGFVLPMAIDRATWIALRPRDDTRVSVHSLDFGESREFDLANDSDRGDGWIEYIRGVAWALGRAGHSLHGWEGVIAGDVPVGAGLSSSAALELATMRAFGATSDLSWNPKEMALLAQRAENGWVGVNCGIMDQLISAAAQGGHALLIDCRSLETRAVPLPESVTIVVLDTGTRRGLVTSAYNERRSECERAASALGVAALRDVDVTAFARRAAELDPVARQRARHVVSENARVLAAANALSQGDVHTVGQLMIESHESLRDDFEVSRDELDIMVAAACEQPGCHGARMTGAGFGGCAVALVGRDAVDAFSRHVGREYERVTGLRPSIHICTASRGASIEPPG